MPRNSSGVYSLPPGYLAVTGQVILASQHNPSLEDIASALTGSQPRNGSAGMLANLPMGGFKVTGMADGTSPADAVTKAQLDAISTTVPDASTTVKGILELATDAETQAGTDTARAITPSNLTAKEATAANYRANTVDRILTTDIVWTSAAEVTLTDAATITVDMSTFINAVVTLGGNRTLGSPTNEKAGQSGLIRIVQDATGSRTLAYGTGWEFTGGGAPTLSTAANSQDLLFYHVIAANRIFANLVTAVS